ncbi:tetratricopeptide repeat protein [Rubrivirga sp.]|uniref:tetratricopeptide repeat protein n=1 Tax=Rubrivirga sp. TaxID=1885344 RepID=UPI003B52D170
MAFALVALAGCAAGPDVPAFANLGPDATYVGAASCATCHGEIADAYATHGMANSSYPLTAETRIEPVLGEPLIDPHTGFEYRVIETADGLAQEERQLDANGREVARLVRPMEVVVGSGDAARTYFARRGDRLVELPLTWYTQGGGRWDFSPGYETSNPRFSRTMPDGCMSCHNAVPERVEGVEDAFASIPQGIGCERCHGPGSVHVEARLAADGPEAGPDPTIVNPKWLGLDLRLDVCSQCHLHATVDVLRQGETAYSYRPGRPLSAHEALFAVPGVDEGGGGIAVVSHAERMQASACFEGSVRTDAPLECVTCHDPHRGFEARPAGAPSAACVTCHDGVADAVPAALRAEHVATTGCVSCHMPRVEADDAPHSSFTDHWIRVVEGPVRGERPEVGRSGVVAPLAEADREGTVGGLYEGMAAVTLGVRSQQPDALARGAQFVQIALDRLDEPRAWHDARFLLGVALLQAGRATDAVAPLRRAAQAAPPRDRPQRLETLARALADAGRDREAATAFRQSLAAQPRRPETHREHGRFLMAHRRPSEAATALAEAVRLDPWDPEARLLLGLAEAARGGDPGPSWREAVRLDPDLAAPLALGVRVGETAEPLWTAPIVFGWPAPPPLAPSAPVVVYSSSGTAVARGPWGRAARELGTGVWVVSAGGAVRRVAVVRAGT